jgi:hypothetical protein
MIAFTAHRMRRLLQAYSASAAITLGALNALPNSERAQPSIAIERLQREIRGQFDPREIVARRIVLTLPWDESTGAGDDSWFSPN